MNKIIVYVLLIAVIGLVGCGDNKEKKEETKTEVQVEATEPEKVERRETLEGVVAEDDEKEEAVIEEKVEAPKKK